MRLFRTFSILLLTPLFAISQSQPKVWTIDQCVQYALDNNIQVKQSKVDQRSSLYSRQAAVANFFPSVNASSSYYWNFGLTVDPVTNLPTKEQRRTFNYGVNGNLVLFNGLQNIKSLKQSNLAYLSQLYTTEDIENDIRLNVAAGFLQILLNREILQVALEQQRVTQLQVNRMNQLVDAGARPKGDLLQLQAQLARDEQNLISARNSLTISKLNLANLMQLEDPADFEVAAPEIDLPGTEAIVREPENIYSTAVENQPDIKSAETSVLSSEEAIQVAKGAMYPSLSLIGGVGSNYSSQVEQLLNQDFGEQLDQNFNQYVGFSLSIPIFSRFQIRNNIQNAQLNLERARLNEQLTRNNLRRDIYQAHADAKASYNSYLAAEKTVESSNESFRYAEERFNEGALNQFDYENAKNNLAVAKSEMLRAKYDFIFKIKVLEFYLTNQVKL